MGQQDTPHLLSGSWRQVCLLKHKSDKAKVEITSLRREQARQEQGKECRQEQAKVYCQALGQVGLLRLASDRANLG